MDLFVLFHHLFVSVCWTTLLQMIFLLFDGDAVVMFENFFGGEGFNFNMKKVFVEYLYRDNRFK